MRLTELSPNKVDPAWIQKWNSGRRAEYRDFFNTASINFALGELDPEVVSTVAEKMKIMNIFGMSWQNPIMRLGVRTIKLYFQERFGIDPNLSRSKQEELMFQPVTQGYYESGNNGEELKAHAMMYTYYNYTSSRLTASISGLRYRQLGRAIIYYDPGDDVSRKVAKSFVREKKPK